MTTKIKAHKGKIVQNSYTEAAWINKIKLKLKKFVIYNPLIGRTEVLDMCNKSAMRTLSSSGVIEYFQPATRKPFDTTPEILLRKNIDTVKDSPVELYVKLPLPQIFTGDKVKFSELASYMIESLYDACVGVDEGTLKGADVHGVSFMKILDLPKGLSCTAVLEELTNCTLHHTYPTRCVENNCRVVLFSFNGYRVKFSDTLKDINSGLKKGKVGPIGETFCTQEDRLTFEVELDNCNAIRHVMAITPPYRAILKCEKLFNSKSSAAVLRDFLRFLRTPKMLGLEPDENSIIYKLRELL